MWPTTKKVFGALLVGISGSHKSESRSTTVVMYDYINGSIDYSFLISSFWKPISLFPTLLTKQMKVDMLQFPLLPSQTSTPSTCAKFFGKCFTNSLFSVFLSALFNANAAVNTSAFCYNVF